jgi:hypothetical protein
MRVIRRRILSTVSCDVHQHVGAWPLLKGAVSNRHDIRFGVLNGRW